MLDGLKTRLVESDAATIDSVEIETGSSRLNPVQRSIQEAVERGNVMFQTVTVEPANRTEMHKP